MKNSSDHGSNQLKRNFNLSQRAFVKVLLLGAFSMLFKSVAVASVVYEGFSYNTSDVLSSQGEATDGWANSWSAAGGGTPFTVITGMNATGSQLVSGGAIQRLDRTNVAQINRQISTGSKAILTEDNTTVWFSVLMNVGSDQNGFAVNEYGTFIFGDIALQPTDGAFSAFPIKSGGNAIGVGFAGSQSSRYDEARIQGVTYKNGVAVENREQRIAIGDETVLIVGKVEWAANGSSDRVSLYKISGPSASLPEPFSVMEVDLDQRNFNVVSIASGMTSVFDEIRIDTTLSGVMALDFMSVSCSNKTGDDVTLGASQLAGVDDWKTANWQNIISSNPDGRSWSISSNSGLSATVTLNTMRNSFSSMTDEGVRQLPSGHGDGDLMDARFNGTENDRNDGRPGKVSLTVSDIPYDRYDVVLYLSRNANNAAAGSGQGVVIFNGESRDFTAAPLFNGAFTEIVNNGDTGDFIVFEDVTGDSFTAEVYGDVSNELGLCGFQIRHFDQSIVNGAVASALVALTEHVKGNVPLDANEIALHGGVILSYPEVLTEDVKVIAASFDLVEVYDNEIGALFVQGSPIQRFSRSSINGGSIEWIVFNVMQNIMDYAYTTENIERYKDLLDGYKFGSSAHFPGAVEPPSNPNATYTVPISGSYLDSFGDDMFHADRPARKPTGAYLAPGSIATVTVPASIVGKGYQVRVGAHSWDHASKPTARRLDRVTLLYDIDSTEVKVANPLGGGIYIEVPYLADAGTINVTIKNAVRSPYFSFKSFHKTTLNEWLNTERHHPGPWADFQSDKFMFQVPTSWVYALDDPLSIAEDWDAACDASNELMGHPLIHGKESFYTQIDLQSRAPANAPGYPTVNQGYDANFDYGGNHISTRINDPRNADKVVFHEHGHGFVFPQLSGEGESTVNLLHVAVWNRKFGYSLDEAFRTSGFDGDPDNKFITLETTAISWMMGESFMLERPMASRESSYQLQGHAKYVDVARLLGWDTLGDFWYSMNEDFENDGYRWPGAPDTDDYILRLSEVAGTDMRPLFHFWGIHPKDPAVLAAEIANANLASSVDIYDTLVRYQALIPADNKEYEDFAYAWYGRKPNLISSFFLPEIEEYHALILDSYDRSYADLIGDNVQKLIDLYFPNGRPPGVESSTGFHEKLTDWLSEYNLQTTQATVEADSDGDGVANLLEYVLNSNPTQVDEANLPVLTTVGDSSEFSFTRLSDSSQSTIQVFQYTSSLETDDWTDLNITEPRAKEVTVGLSADGLQTVSVNLDPDLVVKGKLFIRLKVLSKEE